MDTYSVLGLSLTYQSIAGILLGLFIGVIAYYHRKTDIRNAYTRQRMFSISRDLKHLLDQARSELDALAVVVRKEGTQESKAEEYRYWTQKVQATLQRMEQYPVRDIEKFL